MCRKRFKAIGRDGKTPIYGVICRPPNFEAQRKYPVSSEYLCWATKCVCPKKFSPWHGNLQSYADRFYHVQIDGMGTYTRSKAFHDVCWQNLADAVFQSNSLASGRSKQEPAMNLSRVGNLWRFSWWSKCTRCAADSSRSFTKLLSRIAVVMTIAWTKSGERTMDGLSDWSTLRCAVECHVGQKTCKGNSC